MKEIDSDMDNNDNPSVYKTEWHYIYNVKFDSTEISSSQFHPDPLQRHAPYSSVSVVKHRPEVVHHSCCAKVG